MGGTDNLLSNVMVIDNVAQIPKKIRETLNLTQEQLAQRGASQSAVENMRLYKISERDILSVVESSDVSAKEGEKTVVMKHFPGKLSGFPLKVVYERIENEIFILTAYPLKKKMWR